MKTIVTIASIRPDIPRLQALIKRLDESQQYRHYFITTGQHYDYNRFDIFLEEFRLRKPDIRLHSGSDGRGSWDQSYECGRQLVNALRSLPHKPDIVLYLGDSNSVTSSVAVRRAGFPIGHIEAFMRAYNSPQEALVDSVSLPEELNRRIITQVSDIFFTYHEDYLEHAIREGIPQDRVFVISNTINEAVQHISTSIRHSEEKIIGVDIHRHENIENTERLRFIIDAIKKYKEIYKLDVQMLDFGRTTLAINKHYIDKSGIGLIPLMGYNDFLNFQAKCKFLISDSGTAGEEIANFSNPIPCICPRTVTERPRAVTGGGTFMLQANQESFNESLEWLNNWNLDSIDTSWVGTGKASEQIYEILQETDGKFW